MEDGKAAILTVAILICGAVLVVAPMVVIWSINTLFGLSVPVNYQTWLAALVLLIIFGNSPKASIK